MCGFVIFEFFHTVYILKDGDVAAMLLEYIQTHCHFSLKKSFLQVSNKFIKAKPLLIIIEGKHILAENIDLCIAFDILYSTIP